jgi:hypothetical protein
MPIVGQAPAVVPIPKLSESELRERRESLEEAMGLHRAALEALESALPALLEAQKLVDRLSRVSESVPSNRAVRLSRRLGDPILQASISRAVDSVRSSSSSRRVASQGLGEAEVLIADPGLLR